MYYVLVWTQTAEPKAGVIQRRPFNEQINRQATESWGPKQWPAKTYKKSSTWDTGWTAETDQGQGCPRHWGHTA